MPDASIDNAVRRLMFWRDLPKGSPLPTDMGGPGVSTWDDLIREACTDAISVIEQLRRERNHLRQQLGYESESFRDIKARAGG